MNEIEYILSLKQIHGVGDVTLKNLIQVFGSAQNVFSAKKDDLINKAGLGEKTAELIKGFSDWEKSQVECESVRRSGFKFLTHKDLNYPSNLKNIYNYPVLLQYHGEIRKDDNLSLAVIGSRDSDEYGKYMTELVVKVLVERGITVVSGMARGIDTVAHRSAIKYGGRTIAVTGSGLDVIYPPENKDLYKLISENGYVITEYPLGTKPESGNFPKRNRIISGLSLGVLVIQANRKSGALITAELAIEQNREVFAIPANISNKKSAGCNYLIKSGAKLVESPEDIFTEIKQFQNLKKRSADEEKIRKIETLNGKDKIIVDKLKGKKLHIDELVLSSGISFSDIYPVLLEMEIHGLVRALPGNYFELLHS